MPTYDYQCDACGHRFERLQRMSASPVKKCPACGGAVRRLISGGVAAIVRNPSAGSSPTCGRGSRCCGRDAPCDTPPCE